MEEINQLTHRDSHEARQGPWKSTDGLHDTPGQRVLESETHQDEAVTVSPRNFLCQRKCEDECEKPNEDGGAGESDRRATRRSTGFV
jgi:hypothetical protein